MMRLGGLLFLLGLAALAPEARSQNPPAGTPPGPGGPGGRGGGRGRAVRVMTLSSTAFPDGGRVPEVHAQNGGERSPPLTWNGVPDSTASFVLIVHDLDAATAGGADDTLHWLVWNIPGTATSLPEGVSRVTQLPDGTRQISVSGPYYRGPGAAASGPAHHYVFEVYALDVMLDVQPVGASPAATRAAVIAAMAGHVRAKGVLVGLYKRSAPAER
jgi:Raf kinase inhibitor-like YbhB/YbcL family protein